MTTKIKILGCGTSSGVPMIGNGFGLIKNCVKNVRSRCSIFVNYNGVKLLVDCPPDIKNQLVQHNINCIDGLLITHEHSDHIAGIDDMRWLNISMDKVIDCYVDNKVLQNLNTRFPYIFDQQDKRFNRAQLCSNIVENNFFVNGVKIQTWRQPHGSFGSNGYGFGEFAYCTDLSHVDIKMEKFLINKKVVVFDCLRENPQHSTHMILEQVIEYKKKFNIKNVYLTHMDNTMDYDDLYSKLSKYGIFPCYDGLSIFV